MTTAEGAMTARAVRLSAEGAQSPSVGRNMPRNGPGLGSISRSRSADDPARPGETPVLPGHSTGESVGRVGEELPLRSYPATSGPPRTALGSLAVADLAVAQASDESRFIETERS